MIFFGIRCFRRIFVCSTIFDICLFSLAFNIVFLFVVASLNISKFVLYTSMNEIKEMNLFFVLLKINILHHYFFCFTISRKYFTLSFLIPKTGSLFDIPFFFCRWFPVCLLSLLRETKVFGPAGISNLKFESQWARLLLLQCPINSCACKCCLYQTKISQQKTEHSIYNS